MNYDISAYEAVMSDFGIASARNKEFISVPNAKSVLWELLNYYIKKEDKDKKAVWLPAYDDIANWLGGNRGKGLLLMGPCGCGKTLICSKIFPAIFHTERHKVLSVVDANTFAASPDGYLQLSWLYLDDLGKEQTITNVYGNKRCPVQELTDIFEKRGGMLVITTNLTPDEIGEKYGERTIDRLKNICEFIYISTPQSLRG